MKRRSVRQERRGESHDVSGGVRAKSTADEAGSDTVSYDPGPDRDALSARYGLEFVKDGQAAKVQRLEKEFGCDRVSAWAEEGMMVETMGKPRDMQAFRERQAARPGAIPCDVERQNEASLQRSAQAAEAGGPAGEAGVPEAVRSVISSPGHSLDEPVQREMGSKLGEDFSDVRIHTGPQAAAAAESINARAFTVGNHVAFNRGEYDPESTGGKEVLAHELTHVRQQADGRVSMLPKTEGLEIDPDPTLEKEAEQTARRVVSGETVAETGTHVQRQTAAPVQRKSANIVKDEGEGGSGEVGMSESELEEYVRNIGDSEVPDGVPTGVDELVFHVHGFKNDVDSGFGRIEAAKEAFQESGMDTDVSGLAWDSGDWVGNWWSAKERADEMGVKLATFLLSYHMQFPETEITLQGHSLGTRVVLEAIRVLHHWGATEVVDTAILLVGAVDNHEVSMDGRYGEAIQGAVGNVENYLDNNDRVLNWAFWIAEWTKAIGNEGGTGNLPENWTDHDVTDVTDGHGSSEYLDSEFVKKHVLPVLQ